MTKTKLVFTDRQATAIISLIDEGGQVLTSDPNKMHYLPAILMDKTASTTNLKESIEFMTNLKQIIHTIQKHAVENNNLTNTHIRITIEVDPTKDFTKPVTDLSQITITE
jgi:lysophospholipase L1-like esterase